MAEGDRRVAFRCLPGMRRLLLGEGYGKRADYLVDGQALPGVRIAVGHFAAIVCGRDGRLFHGALDQDRRMGRSDRFRRMLHWDYHGDRMVFVKGTQCVSPRGASLYGYSGYRDGHGADGFG